MNGMLYSANEKIINMLLTVGTILKNRSCFLSVNMNSKEVHWGQQ